MSSFIAIVFATLKEEGIDTEGMSTDEAIKKFNELDNRSNVESKSEFLPQGKAVKSSAKNLERQQVAEIKSAIYNNLKLSNGRKLKEVISGAIEMPIDNDKLGENHIQSKAERIGILEVYKKELNNIVNSPDYIFEDKNKDRNNTILIAKHIDKNVILVVGLNFDEQNHTNTLVTMWERSDKTFLKFVDKYREDNKILYKRE